MNPRVPSTSGVPETGTSYVPWSCCVASGGIYHGDHIPCDPEFPCPICTINGVKFNDQNCDGILDEIRRELDGG